MKYLLSEDINIFRIGECGTAIKNHIKSLDSFRTYKNNKIHKKITIPRKKKTILVISNQNGNAATLLTKTGLLLN